MGVEGAAGFEIPPDVSVDGLVTDREFSGPAEVAGDLFRTPFGFQQFLDSAQLGTPEAQVASGAFTASSSLLVGPGAAIEAIVGRSIAPHFPPKRAPMTLEHSRDEIGRASCRERVWNWGW